MQKNKKTKDRKWTVGFFSFKGGCGRSVGLANIAYALAEHDKCVACVDFDLEAPGLGIVFDVRSEGYKTTYDIIYPRSDGGSDAIVTINGLGPEGRGCIYVIPAPALASGDMEEAGRQLLLRARRRRLLSDIIGGLPPDLNYIFFDIRSGASERFSQTLLGISDVHVIFSRADLQSLRYVPRIVRSRSYESELVTVVINAVPPTPRGRARAQEIIRAVEIYGVKAFSVPYDGDLATHERIVKGGTNVEVVQVYREIASHIIKLTEGE